MSKRVSLIDPILYQSTYVNKAPIINFWKKLNIFDIIFNIILPLSVIVFVLFVLKDRYSTKKKLRHIQKID
jgi:K+-transporting ATPase A subunit